MKYIEIHRIDLLLQKIVNDILNSYDINKINFYQDIDSKDKKKLQKILTN